MRLADLSSTIDHLLPVATLFFTLLLKVSVMFLQAARSKVSGLVYNSLIAYQKRIKQVAYRNRPSALLSKQFGNLVAQICISKTFHWHFYSFEGRVLGLFPFFPLVFAVSGKKSNEDILRKATVEADKLYNEHSYKKLQDFLLQFKVDLLILPLNHISQKFIQQCGFIMLVNSWINPYFLRLYCLVHTFVFRKRKMRKSFGA